MTDAGWVMLLVVVACVSIQDIRTRYVSPALVGPLLVAVLVGWWMGWWPLSIFGAVGASLGTMLLSLPVGDVVGYTLCGLLVGPFPTIWALVVAALGLFLLLHFAGHRINLVRHPFFPYLGTLVVAFTLVDSLAIFTAIFTGK